MTILYIHSSERGGPIPYPPTTGSGGGPNSPPLAPISLSNSANGNGANNNNNNNQQVVVVTSDNPLADLEPDQVRPELKKEGSDWWAIFSPRVPRVLDVSLSLTLTHERCVAHVFTLC